MEKVKAFFNPFSKDLTQSIILIGLVILGLEKILGLIYAHPFVGGLIFAMILGSAIYEGHKSLGRHILRERAEAEEYRAEQMGDKEKDE